MVRSAPTRADPRALRNGVREANDVQAVRDNSSRTRNGVASDPAFSVRDSTVQSNRCDDPGAASDRIGPRCVQRAYVQPRQREAFGGGNKATPWRLLRCTFHVHVMGSEFW